MTQLIDLSGRVIGRWTVIRRAPNQGRQTMWRCRCTCGVERDVWARDLRAGGGRGKVRTR